EERKKMTTEERAQEWTQWLEYAGFRGRGGLNTPIFTDVSGYLKSLSDGHDLRPDEPSRGKNDPLSVRIFYNVEDAVLDIILVQSKIHRTLKEQFAVESDPVARTYRANARWEKGDIDGAIAEYTKAIEYGPR